MRSVLTSLTIGSHAFCSISTNTGGWCCCTGSSRSPGAHPLRTCNWAAPTRRSMKEDWHDEEVSEEIGPQWIELPEFSGGGRHSGRSGSGGDQARSCVAVGACDGAA